MLRKDSPEGAAGCVVPLHHELALGTLSGILKLAKVTPEKFLDNL